MVTEIILLCVGVICLLACAAIIGIRLVVERIFNSVKALPPTKRQLSEEKLDSNPLYRAFPALRGKFAWRALGDFPTPVHKFTIALEGREAPAEFWVKREDLSSARYGGNKVRTLQYQLAACEAHAEASDGGLSSGGLLTVGSGGSNQIVATKVHAVPLKVPVQGYTCMPDEPDVDNTLNYLSSLSLPGEQGNFGAGMDKWFSSALFTKRSKTQQQPWALMPGGNGPLGVLGQAGAAIELAEQIASGSMPDPDGIVVAYGSGCTTTGLVLGIALARAAGLNAFKQPTFRVYTQPVHPGIASMQRVFGLLTGSSMPMAVSRGVRQVSALIAERGGPNVTEAALKIMREELVFNMDSEIIGKYGNHSAGSLAAKKAYDEGVGKPEGAEDIWLCGHFTAKSFALLLKLLRQGDDRLGDAHSQLNLLFWQTKSLVQPKGAEDAWASFVSHRQNSKALGKWAVVGGVTGHPTAVAKKGDLGSERQIQEESEVIELMTPIDLGSQRQMREGSAVIEPIDAV